MTKQKTDRVVLNLTQDQAIELNKFIRFYNPQLEGIIYDLSKRLEKTIAKNKIIDTLRKQNIEPNKEQINR